MSGRLRVAPITLAAAREYVRAHHRHNAPPVGHRFSLSVLDDDGALRGVATVGRPVARALDDGLTVEVNRTCTDGCPNANSMLYGAAWRAARALGYRRMVTYTRADESGASLRAAGARRVAELRARGDWSTHSVSRPRSPRATGGVERVRWEWVA